VTPPFENLQGGKGGDPSQGVKGCVKIVFNKTT
jgi:hypothetical protein